MTGKQRCQALKRVRRQIALANEIPCDERPCGHEGDCPGTCPRCEQELRQLEAALQKRRRLGKAVVVAGISASLAIGTGGCAAIEAIEALCAPTPGTEQQVDLLGDLQVTEGMVPFEPAPTDEPVVLEGEVAAPDNGGS